MQVDLALGLLIGAVVANGLLAGASLDQSIKQLPARRRIGVAAFAAYSQAADLTTGSPGTPPWASARPCSASPPHHRAWRRPEHPADGGADAGGRVDPCPSLVTARAAPANLAQQRLGADERALAQLFDRFERLQTLRAILQVATLGASVWALVATITTSTR
jgi:hypothetical protein